MRTWLCLLLTALLLSSCGTPANKNASPSPQSQKGNKPRTLSNEQTGRNNIPSNQTQSGLPLQAHLESIANRVPGVKSAHCVLFGNTAVVGLDVDGNLDRSKVGTIKYSVAQALRKDPHGANAIVTADVDLSHRIADINKSVQQGHPLSGFGNELSDIIGRIVPQLPRDVAPAKPPEGDLRTKGSSSSVPPGNVTPRKQNTPTGEHVTPRHRQTSKMKHQTGTTEYTPAERP
ncbi:YhcN/YlaJ family sporulation lipoprotein [Paenibacillus sp. J22TS3]|uniref:YhcN/YlaJ family sporulation lipoprotein n=1 Tax=Paenibacillus sp. J22TS3 TaxID=2807192 RepID=UPI001B0C5743|nr:YhcN/YlaJ family sporulation lipoprotein [Paenibacillus sp. J22TS3]GIP20501.1 hypothetical protein J22TS3_07760 [Paenibacillus sp. J22TS3]